MAVFWLVFDGAKGQIRMISVLSTPARVRWVNQYLAASQSGSLRACSDVSQPRGTLTKHTHEATTIATSDK